MDAIGPNFNQDNNFFEVHLKLLHLAGILPRSSAFNSPWKAICYNTFSIIAPIWCVPPLLALLFSIYENWGDISVVTGMVFQLSFVVNCVGIYVYLILNRKSLRTIISISEVAFAGHIKRLGLDRMGLCDSVMAQGYRQNTILSRTLLTINANAYFFWTVLPFIFWCTETENEHQNIENSEINNSYDDGQWKYFCFRMWLPQNATQTPTYQLIYIYQALENSFIILTQATHLTVTLSLMLHLTSQFKVLTACLERVDDVPLYLKEMRTSDDKISGTKPQEYSQSGKEENRNFGHRGRYEVLHRGENDGCAETDGFEILRIQNEEEMYSYLVNCVKYHQLLLQ
jgi:hypothetical protein